MADMDLDRIYKVLQRIRDVGSNGGLPLIHLAHQLAEIPFDDADDKNYRVFDGFRAVLLALFFGPRFPGHAGRLKSRFIERCPAVRRILKNTGLQQLFIVENMTNDLIVRADLAPEIWRHIAKLTCFVRHWSTAPPLDRDYIEDDETFLARWNALLPVE